MSSKVTISPPPQSHPSPPDVALSLHPPLPIKYYTCVPPKPTTSLSPTLSSPFLRPFLYSVFSLNSLNTLLNSVLSSSSALLLAVFSSYLVLVNSEFSPQHFHSSFINSVILSSMFYFRFFKQSNLHNKTTQF
jgi:hypothetical protein